MTWIRLEDTFDQHPKTRMAGAAAIYLHVAALCYSSRCLTDGFVDAALLSGMAGFSRPQAEKHAARLVEVGLWEKAPNGYWIHDYLEYNRSKQAVQKERDAAKERMQAKRSGNVRANTTEAFGKSSPTTAETEAYTETETDKEKLLLVRRNIFALYERTFGLVTETLKPKLEEAEDRYPAEWIEAAFQEAAENKARSWRYVETILKRWEDDGPQEVQEVTDDDENWDDEREAELQKQITAAREQADRMVSQAVSRGAG